MAICGHQFRGGDGSDWILSTSAGCLDGSTTASRILEELFKKHIRSMPNKTPRKRPKTVMVSSENISTPKPESKPYKVENENLIVKKITGTSSFDNFDESQHLNGCPMKWLYQKKVLEKNKMYRVVRPCNKKTVKNEEVRKEKSKTLRDKTPIEVKIHKINLIEKYTNSCDEVFAPYLSFSSEKLTKDFKERETHRKKLAAKLNWKLHDEIQEDCALETSSEISSRPNYLPPRPLLGLKPLLSVLLAPQQENNCCSLVTLPNTSRKNTKIEASLSIQSLDLSLSLPDSKPHVRTTKTLRWGSKSSIHAKKLQIPNPITIKLEEKKKKSVPNSVNQMRVVFNSAPAKKLSERTKHAKSLSSLFYELKGKTNCRHANEMYFDEIIRDLTMEDGQFKIKRFLSIGSAKSDLYQGWEINLEKSKNLARTVSTESELNLVCGKVRFFNKKSSRYAKQEENKKEDH